MQQDSQYLIPENIQSIGQVVTYVAILAIRDYCILALAYRSSLIFQPSTVREASSTVRRSISVVTTVPAIMMVVVTMVYGLDKHCRWPGVAGMLA